jgi:antitoxin VapB
MNAYRHVKLFKNGRNEAVRIPREFELPGQDAIMRRDGDKLIIEAVPGRSLLAILSELSPIEDSFPKIDDPPPALLIRPHYRHRPIKSGDDD